MSATMTPGRPRTMKAVVQEGSGSENALSIRDVAVPEAPDDGVLVKVRAASINAADYHTVHGGWLLKIIGAVMRTAEAPPIRGSDVSGIVTAVGRNVTTLHPGDEVFGTARGSWAEYAIGTERGLVPKPANIPFVEAGAVGIAGITALQGLRDKGAVRPGQRVLVYGAGGGVGTYAVQIAKVLGAHVTAVTGSRNVEVVRPLGADVLVDYTKEDVAKRGERYDVIYDVGAIKSIAYLRRMLVPGGVLILAGAGKRGGYVGLFARIIAGAIRARVFKQRVLFYVASIKRDDLAFLATLLAAGKIRAVIDRTYPLSDVRSAVQYTLAGQGRAKVVLTLD